jgi:long-chain acyl-CoA synthetase
MEVRIDSDNPSQVPGEIQVKGANVFLGYFKNEEATREVFTEDGWFRTGDMGILDEDGCLFIKGRTKCMILGPSGQNIYPEEVETVLNSQPYVVDSLVIEDNGGLTALIYPDYAAGVKDGMNQEAFVKYIEGTLGDLNRELPNYAKLKKIEVMSEDFERTPKKSIKRYLYQRS